MPASATAHGLQLLLFGLPGSGKSALLAALAQAAATQPAVLGGQLADDSGLLTALHQGAEPPPTDAEVVAYPVHFTPPDARPVAATLIDCNGHLAEEYLAGKRPLRREDSALARAMLSADTLLLTVDASLAGPALDAEFTALRRFLELVEQVRGKRADVADLPVWLVLTKCDLLAKPDDTPTRWMQRLEEAKRKVTARFQDFLDDTGAPPFGTVDLNVWATAAHRPGRPAEPYGVAELFRQALASSAAFQAREDRSAHRLEFSVGGLALLVVMLGLLAALLGLTQPDTHLQDLEQQVSVALPTGTAAERLRGPLEERLRQLNAFRANESYPRLPEELRREVEASADETAAYLKASHDLQEKVKKPYQARDTEEFDRFEKQAKAFTLPPDYAGPWKDTRLAKRLHETQAEYAAARTAIRNHEAWVKDKLTEADALLKEGGQLLSKGDEESKAWIAKLREHQRQRYPHPPEQPIPGVPGMTYGDVTRFDTVRDAYRAWEKKKQNLDKLYNLLRSA